LSAIPDSLFRLGSYAADETKGTSATASDPGGLMSFGRSGDNRTLAVLCGLCAASVASVALGQEKPAVGRKTTAAEVVVTGTRIARAGFDTLEPATVIGAEYVAARGLTNVADALNESPGFGTGTTPEGGQSTYGPGVNFVNRFGLGSNRTLTLINGRRFISSNTPSIFGPAAPGNQVDLNFVPTILLDRVENLTVGGAPTYGADAIAGVVNVKLRRDFAGLSAFGQYGQLEDGGMPSNSVGLVGGWNFAGDRGNLTAAVQHSRIDGLRAIDNDRFAHAYSFGANPAPSVTVTQPNRRPDNDGRLHADVPFNSSPNDGVPAAVLIEHRRLFTVNFGGIALPTGATTQSADGRLRCFGAGEATCLQFARNGELVSYDPGTNFGSSDATGGDGLYLMETLQLTSDLERTTATVSTQFDASDGVQLFADLFAYRSEALEIVDQTASNSASFGGASGAITLPATHPLLTQQARDTFAGLGVNSFRISRAHRDLAVTNAHAESSLYQGVVGVTGRFEARDREFTWEAYFNAGKNGTTFFSTQLNRQRFVNALNVVNVGGQLLCSPTPAYAGLPAANGGHVLVGGDAPVADPACAPLDIFGEGRPSAAAIDYVASVQHATATLEQQVFNANIGSSLFDAWGGPVQFNVGFERRHERGRFQPDAYLAAGLGRSAAVRATSGAYTTREVFGEVVVPLVGERNVLPALREVVLIGKGRRVDNSVNGAFTAWTGGVQWSPVEGLQLRGNVTRSLRSPSLTELFTPTAPIFTTVQDPCSTQIISTGPRPDVRATNCAQFFAQYGLPANGWQSTALSSSAQGSITGDPHLRNEKSNAWTLGFVLRPRAVDGFELAADWVDIRIDDVITNLSADDLASACFDNFTFPNPYCDFLTRNPAGSLDPGQITFARAGFANGSYQSMAGLMLDVSYRHTFERLGRMEIAANYFGLREELRSATGISTTNSARQIGSPTDSLQVSLVWERGPIGARWQTNYVGAQLYNRTFTADSRDILELNADVTHNVSMDYEVNDAATVRFAVTNVLDDAPPFPIGTDAFNGNYDFLGRRYSISFTWHFGGR
jgi:outer membrane receptor protein involved in Fe transport